MHIHHLFVGAWTMSPSVSLSCRDFHGRKSLAIIRKSSFLGQETICLPVEDQVHKNQEHFYMEIPTLNTNTECNKKGTPIPVHCSGVCHFPPFTVVNSGWNGHAKPLASYAMGAKDCKEEHELPGIRLHTRPED